jgi:hypothetical protein
MASKGKKILAWIGVSVLGLIALGLAVRAVFNFTTGRKVDRVVRQMQSEGIPLTFGELEPQCPDADNAALIWKAAEALVQMDPERNLLGDATRDYYSGRPPDPARKDRLRKIIEKQPRVISLLLEASAKPCFKYENDWNKPFSELKDPNAVKMIQAIRLFSVAAVLMAEDGQVGEAVERCLAGMRFVRGTLSHPTLINYLVAMANMKQLAVCLQMIVSGRELPDAELTQILKELDVAPWRRGLARSLEGERIMAVEAASGRIDLGGPIDIGVFGNRIFSWVFRPAYRSASVWMLNAYREYIDAASVPYFKSRPLFERIDRELKKRSPRYKLIAMLLPNLTTVMFKEATLEAVLETARIGIACKIHKNAKGAFPENIELLSPDILKEILPDPFTGKAFIYRLQDAGMIVYSLGSNLKDDGGRGNLMITQLVAEKDDDWFWKE